MGNIGLNTLDFLLIIILGIGLLVGIMRGIVPQIMSVVSIWLALVATLWLYKPFSVHILQGVGLCPIIYNVIEDVKKALKW